MKLRLPNSEWCRRQATGLWRWTKRTACTLPGALVSHRFALTLLIVAIALELVIMSVGVVRRLETAAQDATRAAMMEMAAFEAQAFAREQRSETGAASIGTVPPAVFNQEDGAETGAPPLRPRDVDTIVSQDTDDWIASWGEDLDGDGDAKDNGKPEEGDGAEEGDADEVDHFIRQGVAALTAGDMRRCILYLEQARAMSPNHPATLYYIGMAYDKLLNPAKARIYYTQVFNMRDQAGKYFERASRRLSYGVDLPSDMRGKLAFGPYRVNHTYNEEEGEKVEVLLPVLLSPGEELKPDAIFIKIRFFDLVNNRSIEFAHNEPLLNWEKEQPDWQDGEENLVISYSAPPLTQEEKSVYGDVSYYGFIAKLYYNGEPLDCISTPSSLILHEQRLNIRATPERDAKPARDSLLPEDSLLPADDDNQEEAVPFSDFLDELDDIGT